MTRYNVEIEDDDDEAAHVESVAVQTIKQLVMDDSRIITIEADAETVDELLKRDNVRRAEEDVEQNWLPEHETWAEDEPEDVDADADADESEGNDVGAASQTTPWGVDRIAAPASHTDGFRGEGAVVAVIDTGVDSDHPDIQENLVGGHAVVTCDPPTGMPDACNEPWDDDHSHGTHVAGTVAAVDNTTDVIGVAPSASIYAVKALDGSGSGSYSGIAEAIQHAADQGVDVINMSLGGSSDSFTVSQALQYAVDRDVLVICAAGNSGACTDCVAFPARDPNAVAVTAANQEDGLAFFSSQGPEAEVMAPGYEIPSLRMGGGVASHSGTSMACPHVAGAAALIRAEGVSASATRSRFESTCVDVGLPSNEQGHGLVSAVNLTDTITMARKKTFENQYTIDATERTLINVSFQVDTKPVGGPGQATLVTEGNEAGDYYVHVTHVPTSDTLVDEPFTLSSAGEQHSTTIPLPTADADYDILVEGGIVTTA